MIIVYKEPNINGKLEFTKDEFEKMLQKANEEGYNTGYSEGYKEGYHYGCKYPIIPEPIVTYEGTGTKPKTYETTISCKSES